MICIIPRANLVQNIGFDAQATHTVERDFAGLEMHAVTPADFPLVSPREAQFDGSLDDRVFANHYRKLEGRRNLWQKARDRVQRILGKKPASLSQP
jgi:hypothetical protein